MDQVNPEELLLLKEGHCLREHALAACRLANRRKVGAVEATSLHTLVQMVDNGLGITLLPELATSGGILKGTAITFLPAAGQPPSREIGLVWRRGTGRQREFELLADMLKQLPFNRFCHLMCQKTLIWPINGSFPFFRLGTKGAEK
jgi:LysR family transcriptional regulator, hydrogen peroxide-inducible genes activator